MKPLAQRLNKLSSQLDIILFKEKKDESPESAEVIKMRAAGLKGGAIAGAGIASFVGAEQGGVPTAGHAAKATTEAYAKEAGEDLVRKVDTAHARGQSVDLTPEQVKLYERIKSGGIEEGKIRALPPQARQERLTSGATHQPKGRPATIKKPASQLLTKARHTVEDVTHGAGRWLKRNSTSRNAAAGAIVGGIIGRHYGAKMGHSITDSRREQQKRAAESRMLRKAGEIAKVKAIAEALRRDPNSFSSITDGLVHLSQLCDAIMLSSRDGEEMPSSWSQGGYKYTRGKPEKISDDMLRAAILGGYSGDISKLRMAKIKAEKEPGTMAHLKRNKGKYIAGTVAAGLATAAGLDYRSVKARARNMSAMLDEILFGKDYLDEIDASAKKWDGYKFVPATRREVRNALRKGARYNGPQIIRATQADNMFDSRPRDNTGQYAPQQAGGVDPMAMRQAYEHIRRQEAAKKRETWGKVKRGVMTAGAIGLTGYGAHRIGRSQGLKRGLAQSEEMVSSALKKAKQEADDILNAEREGFGSVMERMKGKAVVDKEVSRDRLQQIHAQAAEIEKLRKEAAKRNRK